MRHFPIFLELAGQRVVIVGGGEAAVQKARLLARTLARLEIMAEAPAAELRVLAEDGRASLHLGALDPARLAGARLVVVATGCAALDAVAADLARRAGALVNVVDRPALSDALMPAIVDRDPVVVAIGTEGAAPVLARQIKTRIEGMLEPGLGRLADLAGNLRAEVARRIPGPDRRRFWEWFFAGPRRLFAAGETAAGAAAIRAALAAGGAPAASGGRISLIDPGTGAADLMTLRAVERLQQADILVHDAGCPVALLDLARRDAARQVIDVDAGPARWGPGRIARQVVLAAEGGREVVVLSSAPGLRAALAAMAAVIDEVPAVPAPPLSVRTLAEDG